MHHCYSYICRSTGICDGLLFLLNEELTRIQLCALHIDMRNTEQLLASMVWFPQDWFTSRSQSSPEVLWTRVFSWWSNFFQEEERSGVCHFKAEYSCELSVGCASGRIIGFVCILKLTCSVGTYYFLTVINTFQVQQNFKFLKNLQEIVELFLPLDKLKLSYTDVISAKNFILNHVTFCQSHIDVSLWYQMLQWQVPSLVVQQFKFTVL